MIKTIELTAGEEMAVELAGGVHARIENRGTGIVYASKSDNVTAGEDGVVAVSSGGTKYLKNACSYANYEENFGYKGIVYLKSSEDGIVEIETGDYFFDSVNKSEGGGSPIDSYTKAEIDIFLADKVNKETGKGLSANDYTSAEKNKLAGLTNYDDSEVRADISTIAKHINGDLTDSDFYEDTTAVMTKTVPSGMGNYAAVKSISGKTQKFNQLANPTAIVARSSHNGISYSVSSDGEITVSGTSEAVSMSADIDNINIAPNHIYYIKLLNGTSDVIFQVYHSGAMASNGSIGVRASTGNSVLYKRARIRVETGKTVNIKVRPMLIDLTAMFGAGNEPTAAEFEAMFSEAYYPYTEGELWNASVESVVSTKCTNYNLNTSNCVDNKYINTDGNYVNTSSTGVWCSIDTYFPIDYVDGIIERSITDSDVIVYDENKNYVKFLFTSSDTKLSAKIPSNAKYFRYDVKIANKNELVIKNTAFKTTLLLSDALKSLPDWGCAVSDTIYNWIDFENMIYHHCVSQWKPDASSEWGYNSSTNNVYRNVPSDAKKVTNFNMICNMYTKISNSEWYATVDTRDKVFASGTNGTQVQLIDRSCTTLDQYKTKLIGLTFNYELATEELIDISNMLPPIRVEEGGTITLQNEHNFDMPNTLIYKKEMVING